MYKRIQKIVEDATAEGVFSSCVIGVTGGGEFDVLAFGGAKENSIFDIASVTKVVPTSTLALKLLEEGRVGEADPLINYLPNFQNSHRDKVTIRHLLTYGLDYDFRLSDYKNSSADEILDVIFKTEFRSAPGEKFFYTNATSILLGLVVEKIYGEPLDVIAKREIFDPLNMSDTSFHPQKLDFARILPSEIDDWRGREIRGEVHDESAWKLREKMIAGSAGVFSTAPDLLKFLAATLENDAFAGLGWESAVPWMGRNNLNRFGKTGFTGSAILIDKALQKGIVILSNYTYPKRSPDLPRGRNDFFKKIADTIFDDN